MSNLTLVPNLKIQKLSRRVYVNERWQEAIYAVQFEERYGDPMQNLKVLRFWEAGWRRLHEKLSQ